MAGLFRLFNSAYEANIARSLWLNQTSLDTYALSEFTSDSRPTIDYTLLLANPSGGFDQPWSRVAAASYSLEMGLYRTSDRSQLTLLTTFTNLEDGYTKNGTLLLDTAAINAILTGAVYDVACTFEIFVTDATGNRQCMYRNTGVTLRKPLIPSGSASPDPTRVMADVNFVKATCVPRDGTDPENPCQEFYMKANGIGYRIYIDSAGRLAAEAF